jgi:hypothetical protein
MLKIKRSLTSITQHRHKAYRTELNVRLRQQVKLRNLAIFQQNSLQGKFTLTQDCTSVLKVSCFKQMACLFM